MNWISVKDKVPLIRQKVIIFERTTNCVTVDFITQIDKFGQLIWGVYQWLEDAEITHWMPLPNGPFEDLPVNSQPCMPIDCNLLSRDIADGFLLTSSRI